VLNALSDSYPSERAIARWVHRATGCVRRQHPSQRAEIDRCSPDAACRAVNPSARSPARSGTNRKARSARLQARDGQRASPSRATGGRRELTISGRGSTGDGFPESMPALIPKGGWPSGRRASGVRHHVLFVTAPSSPSSPPAARRPPSASAEIRHGRQRLAEHRRENVVAAKLHG